VPASWPETAADRFAVVRLTLAPSFLAESVDSKHQPSGGTVTGLDDANVSRLLIAIRHASRKR
jgi:hypothetical protein